MKLKTYKADFAVSIESDLDLEELKDFFMNKIILDFREVDYRVSAIINWESLEEI